MAGQITEVAAHAVFQYNGLADVDNLAGGIVHQVNAGLFRQYSQGIFYIVAKACG